MHALLKCNVVKMFVVIVLLLLLFCPVKMTSKMETSSRWMVTTLQVATILVAMAPKILELATWFGK